MKQDLYTKTVLTVIAIALSTLVTQNFMRPQIVRAESGTPQFAAAPGALYFFTPGYVQVYGTDGSRKPTIVLK